MSSLIVYSAFPALPSPNLRFRMYWPFSVSFPLACRLYLCSDALEGEADCRDGHGVCMPCGRPPHSPAACANMPDWDKRAGGDVAGRIW